jgi:hypothetical protein
MTCDDPPEGDGCSRGLTGTPVTLASGSRFLFITTNVIIDSVDTPGKTKVNYLLVLLYKDTPVFYFSFILPIDSRVI